MRRTILVLFATMCCVRCASFSADTDGLVRYESINRDTVLLRFTSSPAGSRALIDCAGFTDHVTTPGTARLPIDELCTVTFVKAGYREEVTEFDPAAFAHSSTLSKEPDCGDRGVWCDAPESFGRIIFGSLFIGMSGLIARAADPIRHGRGEIGAILEPLQTDNGSDSAQPRG